MTTLHLFFVTMLIAQITHSFEEYFNGLPSKFPWFKINTTQYLTYEIPFNIFWICVLFIPTFPLRQWLMYFFMIMMFANGLWHLVWSGLSKKYTPGLVTACAFILIFIAFYFRFSI